MCRPHQQHHEKETGWTHVLSDGFKTYQAGNAKKIVAPLHRFDEVTLLPKLPRN